MKNLLQKSTNEGIYKMVAFVFICISCLPAFAQPGVLLSYNTNGLKNAEGFDVTQSALYNRIGMGFDYKFKHPTYRFYYAPEISWQGYQRSFSKSNIEQQLSKRSSFWTTGVRLSLYPLNIKGDCNCPTFRRENPFFKRGFYLVLLPQITFVQIVDKYDLGPDLHTVTDKLIVSQIGAGAGLDIGLSPELTITPELLANAVISSSKEMEKYSNQFISTLYLSGAIRIEYRIKSDSWH